MRARWLWVSFPFLFASCPNDPPPKPKLDLLVRFSSFTKLFDGAAGEQPVGDERVQVGGVVNETLDFGGLVFIPPGEGPMPRPKYSPTIRETPTGFQRRRPAPCSARAPPSAIPPS